MVAFLPCPPDRWIVGQRDGCAGGPPKGEGPHAYIATSLAYTLAPASLLCVECTRAEKRRALWDAGGQHEGGGLWRCSSGELSLAQAAEEAGVPDATECLLGAIATSVVTSAAFMACSVVSRPGKKADCSAGRSYRWSLTLQLASLEASRRWATKVLSLGIAVPPLGVDRGRASTHGSKCDALVRWFGG